MNYIGIDIGGMSVKGMIVDENANVICKGNTPTGDQDGGDTLCENICALISRLLVESDMAITDIEGIGIGCPGMIDSQEGVVVFAGNLALKNFPLAKRISERLNKPVKLTNDANAAALGEAKFGAGKQYKDSILVTLGTGVGGGIIIDGKLFEGGKSAGTEIGHSVIVEDGYPCTCGRKGCFECYSSATALIRKTREVMMENRSSAMRHSYTLETVTGKTAFEYAEKDDAAKSVVDWYIKYLACGLTNLANVFRPQVIMLGGGISKEGDKLTIPLQQKLNEQIFAGMGYAPVKIVCASLGNDAGALGAAALIM